MSVTTEERQKIQGLIGNTASIMSAAIARLYLASPDPTADRNNPQSIFATFPHLNAQKWAYTNVQGALVFLIDRVDHTFVFQMWDLNSYELRFEYELYYDIEYISLDPNFHSFEMQECVAGFSFSSAAEAKKFFAKVKALKPSAKDNDAANMVRDAGKKGAKGKGGGGGLGGLLGFGKKKKKEPEVSSVLAVRHHQHVGLNDDGTLDLSVLSPEWKQFFKKAGVKKKDLTNPETAAVIFKTVEQSGFSLGGQAPNEMQYQEAPNQADIPKEVYEQQKQRQQQHGGGGGGGGSEYNQQGGGESGEADGEFDLTQYTRDELAQIYTPEQLAEYDEYMRQLREYEEAQAEYERAQQEYQRLQALEAWENDNKELLKQQEKDNRKSKSKKAPPPLPPRKEKKKKDQTQGQGQGQGGYQEQQHQQQQQHQRQNRGSLEQESVQESSVLPPPDEDAESTPPPPPPPSQQQQEAAQSKKKKKAPPLPTRLPSKPELPAMPPRPAPPTPPSLPNLPQRKGQNKKNGPGGGGGGNPMAAFQKQLTDPKLRHVSSVKDKGAPDPTGLMHRPTSRMFLNAIAGSRNNLKDAGERQIQSTAKPAAGGETDLLNNLASALAQRRKHLSAMPSEHQDDDDDDSDWSD